MIDYSKTSWEGTIVTTEQEFTFEPDVLQEKVHAWLLDNEYSVRKESPPNTYWAFVAEDRRGLRLVVGQFAGKSGVLTIQAEVGIDDATQARVDRLPALDREQLLWDMRFELVKMGVPFEGIELPLKLVRLSRQIFEDGLTEDAFFDRVEAIRMGTFLVIFTLAKKFGWQPPIGFQPPQVIPPSS